jgi:hypothetical protein
MITSSMKVTEKIVKTVRYRLGLMEPFILNWKQVSNLEVLHDKDSH